MICCADEQGVQLKLTPSVDWDNLCWIIRLWSTQHEVLHILVILLGESCIQWVPIPAGF